MFLRASIPFALGPTLLAQSLSYPVDVAVQEDGTVYVADHEQHAVLRLQQGQWQTVAQGEGKPRTPLFGIRHIDPSDGGQLVASDPATMKLYRVTPEGEVTPVADDDSLITPWGVLAESGGRILVVDRVTHQLKSIRDGEVEIVATIRAPRAIVSAGEQGIVVLTDDNLVLVQSDGTTRPLLSDSPFQFPHDVVRHPDGHYYVSDGYAKTIWRVGADGGASALVSGAPLASPQGLALLPEGDLIVADAHAGHVFQITTDGKISKLTDQPR